MKPKNIVLDFLAITVAIGSAFATIDSTDVEAYLKVQYYGEAQPRCIRVGACSNVYPLTCAVTVTDLSSSFWIRPIDCPVQTLKHEAASIGSYNDSGTIIAVIQN